MAKFTAADYRKAVEVWKRQNPNKDYTEIEYSTEVEVDGKIIKIGKKISMVRSIYKAMQEGKKMGNCKDLTEEEIDYWNSLGLLKRKREPITEEEYREAIKIWKKENPDKDYSEISKRAVVKVNGKEIQIGDRIKRMRSIYNGRKDENHNLTEEQIEYWNSLGLLKPSERKKTKITEEEYREAIKIWKKQNPDKDFTEITRNVKIEINGKVLSLGVRINDIRQTYKAMSEGRKYGTCKNLTDEQIAYWGSLGLLEAKKKNTTASKSTQTQLDKYTEIFNGDKEKAERVVKCLTDLRERRKSKKKEDYNVNNILKEFDVDIETLEKYLNKTRSKEITKRSKPLEYQGLTLREFCIKNGYNYDVVYRAIKLHEFCKNDSLEQLINRSITTYQRKGQKEPSTWVYEKYGNLVKHILLYLRLDASKILNDMSNYTISLEEAIRHNIFLHTKQTKEQDYLEEVYNYLIEEVDSSKTEEQIIQDIILKYQELAQEYRFTKEEHEVVITSFERYIKTIKEYQKADVGLETNQSRKIEKIKDYGLEAEDIEESFFIPLEFDNKALLGRKSELYLRRQLLRQYIIDWDFYTDEEKEVIKLKHQFTEEEIKIIESTRRNINEVIEKTR